MAEAVVAPQAQAQLEEEEVYLASQWRLMWWRFRKHKPAIIAFIILALFYTIFPLAEFFGMGDPAKTSTKFVVLRPQPLRFFDEGSFSPHVNGLVGFRDPATFKKEYIPQPEVRLKVRLFAQGYEYHFLGFLKSNLHLVGFSDPEVLKDRPSLYLLGGDSVGRDQWSRLMLATRISLSVGFVGVMLSLIIGIVLGAISGFYGEVVDTIIQRIIEIVNAVPGLPLWMGLSAAVPQSWSVIQVYFAITVILSIFGWTGMARVVRGKFLALREEDFVTAATLAGASEARIMFRHMLPSFYSHIIASLSLGIPGMIIGETALSFLGLGLRAPAVSYGIMLQQAQNPSTVALYPWLMFVAIPVIIIILSFNFLGDGLRDAADPYGQ
jgi:peptide/nickel transport system permease protein